MVTKEHLDDPLLHAVSASQNAANRENEQPTLYLNILVRRLDVLPDVPASSASNPLAFSFLRQLGGSPRAVGSAAQNVTEDVTAGQAAERIPQLVPGKLAELGCTAEVEEVFQKGAFVILRVTVLQYDAAALLGPGAEVPQPTKGPGCLAFLACCCGQQKAWGRKADSLAVKVAEKLCTSMPEALSDKLSDKDLFVDVVAKTEADEAAYFFVALKELH